VRTSSSNYRWIQKRKGPRRIFNIPLGPLYKILLENPFHKILQESNVKLFRCSFNSGTKIKHIIKISPPGQSQRNCHPKHIQCSITGRSLHHQTKTVTQRVQEGSDTPATKEKCRLFTHWSGGMITVKRFSSDDPPAGTSMAADFTRDLALRRQSRTE
jgi:hypothetical protein